MTLTLIIVRQNLHPDFKMSIRGEISPILVIVRRFSWLLVGLKFPPRFLLIQA